MHILAAKEISKCRAYSRHTRAQKAINFNDTANCKFEVGAITLKRTTLSQFPTNNVCLHSKMHIDDTDAPPGLSLARMDHLRLRYDNIVNTIKLVSFHITALIKFRHGHSFTTWDPLTYCLFTDLEL